MPTVKTSKGWQVRDAMNRPQSKDDLTKIEADEREKELREQKKIAKWMNEQKRK